MYILPLELEIKFHAHTEQTVTSLDRRWEDDSELNGNRHFLNVNGCNSPTSVCIIELYLRVDCQVHKLPIKWYMQRRFTGT